VADERSSRRSGRDAAGDPLKAVKENRMDFSLMTRTLTIVAAVIGVGLANGPAAVVAQTTARQVDVVTLAIAVRAGQAQQYKGYVVTGEGRSFDTQCTPADPKTKTDASVVLVVGALGRDNKPGPVQTLDDWYNFQLVGRPMLVVKLRGQDLKIKPEVDPQRPVVYAFTARFTGDTESMTPQPSITDNAPKAFDIAVLVEAVAK
jgi:hypothetical protein